MRQPEIVHLENVLAFLSTSAIGERASRVLDERCLSPLLLASWCLTALWVSADYEMA